MNAALWLIKIGVAATMIAFGVHQMTRPRDWAEYVPKWLDKLVPIVSTEAKVQAQGFGNIALGLFLASPFAVLVSASAALLWYVWILPFAYMVNWRVALRDTSIALSLAALVSLAAGGL